MMDIRQKIEETLGQIEELPSLPSTVIALQRALQNPDSGAEDIASVLSLDPGLAGKLLRVANSARYAGGAAPITSVAKAVARVGFREVGGLFTTLAVLRAFDGFGERMDHHQFWKHSLTAAIGTRVIASYSDRGEQLYDPDSGHIAGLLHDVGVLVLDQFLPKTLRQVWQTAEKEGAAYPEVERNLLGIDHGEIGGMLLERWNLPTEVVEAVRHHHAVEQAGPAHRSIAKAVFLADAICTHMGIGDGGDGPVAPFDDLVWEDLGLSVDVFPAMISTIEDEANRSEQFLEVTEY